MQQKKSKWNSKGYGFDTDFYRKKPWLQLRKKYIEANPLCQLSLQFDIIEPAEIVDHIIPRRITQEFELDENNLQSLGFNMHTKKTALERDINNISDFVKELTNGKLQYICLEEKKEKLIKMIKEKGLI